MTLYTFDPEQKDEPRGSRGWAFLGGAIAGALVVAVAWWGAAAVDPGAPPADQRSSGPAARSGDRLRADRVSADPAAGTTYLERCREVFAAQQAPLRASAGSLSQWEVHIGAMNKLVTGAITLQQATQFWNRTRIGASARLHRAAAARDGFGRRTARCPSSATPDRLLPEERSCARAVDARNRTLRLATTALETWQVHVHHMEMLRRGEMTPADATRMWLQSWHTGDAQVRAYRAAARVATRTSGTACCSADEEAGTTACG